MSFPKHHFLQLALICIGSAAAWFVFLAHPGCGFAPREKANASGQTSFDTGMAAIKEQSWESALEQFEIVLTAGSINPDQIGELYAHQALAFAKLGRFREAEVAIKNAKQGADQRLVDEIVAQIEKTKRPH